MMLVVYGRQDYNGKNDINWLEDEIVFIFHTRTEAFDDSSMQASVRKDGEMGASGTGTNKFVYRHHIPYQRIYLAIEDTIVSEKFSRLRLLEWLTGRHEALGIEPDKSLVIDDARKKRLIYDIWVDWAVSAICQFKDNIFYGPGTGDGAGTKIDFPNGENKDAQLVRLTQGKEELKTALPNLNDAKIVALDRSSFKLTGQDIKTDEALVELEKRLLADTEAYVAREGLWGRYPENDPDDGEFEPPEGWEDKLEK